jgi:hypothetical protein
MNHRRSPQQQQHTEPTTRRHRPLSVSRFACVSRRRHADTFLTASSSQEPSVWYSHNGERVGSYVGECTARCASPLQSIQSNVAADTPCGTHGEYIVDSARARQMHTHVPRTPPSESLLSTFHPLTHSTPLHSTHSRTHTLSRCCLVLSQVTTVRSGPWTCGMTRSSC